MAGGGIRGGQIYGSSDRLGEYPADHPVTQQTLPKPFTMLWESRSAGRRHARTPFHLLEDGKPILPLFG